MPDTEKDVIDRCLAAGVVQVELQFADIAGAVKNVSIPVRRLPEVLQQGEWFDGSAIEGSARELESDMYLRPDPETFALIDPDADVVCARLLCDVVTPDGQPYRGDSRGALRGILNKAAEAGLGFLVAPEVEFFLFPGGRGAAQGLADDWSSYFERGGGGSRLMELEGVAALERSGVEVEPSHHEVPPGQYELALPLLPALAA